MRTVSAAQEKIIASGEVSNWVKVEIKDDGASWQNMNDLEGRDWVIGFRMSRSVDAQMASAVVDLKMRDGYLNLSPLMAASKINATNVVVDTYHQIRISTATTPLNIKPLAADYSKVFQGRIEKLSFRDGATMQLHCLDDGVVLANTFIETVKEYGTGGAAPETIIGSILTDWASGSVYGAATGAVFNRWDAARNSVLDEIRKLSHAIGWDVRYKWWAGTGDLELVMYEPDRDLSGYGGGATDRTYTQAQWSSLGMEIPSTDVRNKIVCVYYDASNGASRTIRTTDDIGALSGDITTSQTKYGTRWCEFSEDASSRLDSSGEVDTFLTAAFYDLWEPTANVTMEVPYLFAFELNDVIGLTADQVHFDSDQRLALYAIEDSVVNGGRGVSRLNMRGTPTMGVGTWLNKQVQYSEKSMGGRNHNKSAKSRSGNLCPNFNFADQDW